MSQYLQRSQLLIEQSRYKQAEAELRKALAADPENAQAHALLAISLSEQKKYDAALREAQQTIALAPDWAYSHYVLALVFFDKNKLNESEQAIQEAIRLDPQDERFFAVLSNIHLQQKKWQLALEAAEEGLKNAPEDVTCTNLRAMALLNLGRKEEAGATIEAALTHEPHNAVTHANQGWTLLQRGEHQKALEHFREALRLEPTLDWAREGIVEALKARNLIYRMMLRYFFRMARLSGKAQWMVIIGAYLLFQLLSDLSKTHPEWAPVIWPLMVCYLIFVLLSWISEPLFDLLLRLNRFGRLALSHQQIIASNWVGGCIAAALAALSGGFITGNSAFYLASVTCGAMIVPIAGVFKVYQPKNRYFLAGYAILLGVLGLSGILLGFFSGMEKGALFAGAFFIGWILYSWVANWVISRE